MFKFRKPVAVVLTSALAVSAILSASAASTGKNLSSNFTLVNLVSGANNGEIRYVEPDGSQWRDPQNFQFDALGDQAIYRQYEDGELSAGSGSVVVSTDGPVGAVVQIQAREQTPTSGAYIGVSEGATSANVPLVSRRGNSLSGRTNSQIIVQNASSQVIDAVVDLIDASTGNVVHSRQIPDLAPNASFEYDLDDEGALPEGFFGSASVRSETSGGEVAVVSNFFTGDHAMQTFNAFTSVGRRWYAPLFTSRLPNTLSTPIAVQNVSGGVIPQGAITLTCTQAIPSDPGEDSFTRTNPTALQNTASVFFNPAPEDSGFPANWYGSCVVDTGNFDTAMFVQMRFVNGDRAGAYEGILGTGTDTQVIIPLYAKRLGNTFASAVTFQNLSSSAATVNIVYNGAEGTPDSCSRSYNNLTIPANGSLIHNHRIPDGDNSVPEIADGCFGSITATSNQPIDAFVQLDFTGQDGDAFMAHNAFTIGQ